MRGADGQQGSIFSDRSLEDRIALDHPLRPMRALRLQILFTAAAYNLVRMRNLCAA